MPLIISPITTPNFIKKLTSEFNAKPIERNIYNDMWYNNFKEQTYEAEINNQRTFIMFPGYSGPVIMQALFHDYSLHIKNHDPKPEAYFIGRVFTWPNSNIKTGEIGFVEYVDSPDSTEQALYKIAKQKEKDNSIEDYHKPNPNLQARIEAESLKQGFELNKFRTISTMTPNPEVFPNIKGFNDILSLTWRKIVAERSDKFNSGEYETACFYAASKILDLPAIAMIDVKDKKNKNYSYTNIGHDKPNLDKILTLIRSAI